MAIGSPGGHFDFGPYLDLIAPVGTGMDRLDKPNQTLSLSPEIAIANRK